MNQSIEFLMEVSRSFNELLDLDELLPLVIRRSKDLLNADGSAVLLVDTDSQELYFPYTAEADPEVDRRLAGLRIPLDRGIAGCVVRSGTAELVADAPRDERWNPDVDRQTGMETRSLLTAPLHARRGVIGVVQVRSSRVDAFGAADLKLLETLAKHIAVAIDNARQYREVKIAEQGLREQVAILHREMARSSRFADIVGASDSMQRVFRLVEAAITAPVTVLLRGETGTGKELIARAIHFNSARAAKPFVAINCAALSDELLESELFGHRRGAFTGALEDRRGFFEAANGGTIFLDEVGEMKPAMQVKLLRVLQNAEVIPVGESTPRRVDVRVISATNSELDRDVAEGRFRSDLYYRLSTFPIAVPPLRARSEDIPVLADHLLRRTMERFGKTVAGIHRHAMELMVAYDWPGNVRQLQNEIERAVVLTPAGEWITPNELSAELVTPRAQDSSAVAGEKPAHHPEPAIAAGEDAPPSLQSAPPWLPPAGPLRAARAAFESHYLAEVLRQQGGNISAAARVLSLSRGALRDKLKEYGIR
jgi:Nif-specific regulatory protein